LIFIAMSGAYFSAKLALPTIIIAGVPYFLLFLKLRRGSPQSYVASGALMGLGAFVVMTAWKYF
jgi:hypothetical protein